MKSLTETWADADWLRHNAETAPTEDVQELAKHGITPEQWARFSWVQSANWLVMHDGGIERCKKWLETGDDEDALT